MIYKTFGLTIRSSLELPEMQRVGSSDGNALRKASRNARSICQIPQHFVDLSWSRVGRFRVTEKSITIFRKSGAKDDLVRTYLLGPALAVLLHLRQRLVLHSSAVEIGGKAVAFMGDSGTGKSTLAFALGRRGYSVLSDDLLVLKKNREQWIALSGPSLLKLWPDMACVLGAGNSRFKRIHSQTTKRMAKPELADESCAIPLSCIYSLNIGRSLGINKSPSRQQFWDLVRNAYCRTLANARDAAFYFTQCAQLVRDIPVRQLHRTRRRDEIRDLVEMIERDQETPLTAGGPTLHVA